MPEMSSLSLKLAATLTASWPVIASATKRISCGLKLVFRSTSSCINSSSTWSLPAVSIMMTSKPFWLAYLIPAWAIETGFCPSWLNTLTPI